MGHTGEGGFVALDVHSPADLARALRELRRRHARQRMDTELSYREIAAKSGYAHGVIGDYFTGKVLPPTDRLDVLVQLLGATKKEQHAFAAARDRLVEERRQPVTPASAAGPPRQLPAAVRHFAGRGTELRILDDLAGGPVTPASGPVVAVITGMAGVGKTALAVHWAHRIAGRFPGGQLYLNLRGFDPGGEPVPHAEAVRAFLDALGVPASQVPASAQAQAGLLRSMLAGRRVLMVLDNARDADQVQPLLPGSPDCLAVVTSRSQLTGLVARGCYPLPLELPSPADCYELLEGLLQAGRAAAEPQATGQLIELCGRLPLALSVTAARAVAHPDFPLAALAAEIRAAGSRLDAWPGPDMTSNVRTVLSWSYRTLSPSAASLFRLLGLHPGPDISLPAAASLAGLPQPRMRLALTELSGAHLLTEHTPGRFALHDLLRAYAAELASTMDSDNDRRAATNRLLDHLLHASCTADQLVNPHRPPITVAPAEAGTAPAAFTTGEQALAWFAAERPVLLAVIAHAAENGFSTHAWQIPWALSVLFDRQGYWHDWVATHRTALAAATQAGDPQAQAAIHRGLGNAFTRLSSYQAAQAHMERVVELCSELGDQPGQAIGHLNLGWAFEQQGRFAEALEQARCALSLSRELGDRPGEAAALGSVGWCHVQLGNLREALTSCQQGLALDQELGNRHGQASDLDSLGLINHRLGDHRSAITCYQQALALFMEADRRQLPHAYSDP